MTDKRKRPAPPAPIVGAVGAGKKERRKPGPKPSAQLPWEDAFIQAFGETGSVMHACKAVKIGGRSLGRRTVYRRRSDSPAFRERWSELEQVTIDNLEDSALKRAVEGWLEPVYYKGEVKGARRMYSDALTIFMLKKRRPETYADAPSEGPQSPGEYAEQLLSAIRAMDGSTFGTTSEFEALVDDSKAFASNGAEDGG